MIAIAHDIFDQYTGGEPPAPDTARVVLNMLVGDTYEPFLPASLDALFDQVDWAVINFNGQEKSPGGNRNLHAILASRFNQEDRITLSAAPFRNYAFNRNICLELSPHAEWIAQFDPDEVIYPGVIPRVIKALDNTESPASRVCAYYWHFLKSVATVQNQGETDPTYYKPFLWKQVCPVGIPGGWNSYWIGATHERKLSGTAKAVDLRVPQALWCHFGYINPEAVFHKWLQFAAFEGRPDQYRGYFADPRAPWRTGPEKILDDRKQFVFEGVFPPVLKGLRIGEAEEVKGAVFVEADGRGEIPLDLLYEYKEKEAEHGSAPDAGAADVVS